MFRSRFSSHHRHEQRKTNGSEVHSICELNRREKKYQLKLYHLLSKQNSVGFANHGSIFSLKNETQFNVGYFSFFSAIV